MATNALVGTSGSFAWDVAANWSLGRVPISTDDVVITGQASTTLTVTIAANDPAYTIASLTETTSTATSTFETLNVSGQLTVTGATTVSAGNLSVGLTGQLNLNSVALSNSAFLSGGNGAGSNLSITSLSGGTASAFVGSGPVTIGSIGGPISIGFSSGGAATVGSVDGNGSFSLSSNVRLTVQGSATTFGDVISPPSATAFIDLAAIAYQAGETATTTLVSSSPFNTYSVVLKASGGQTLYTFQKVYSSGGAFGSVAPTVSLASDGAGGTLVTLACYTGGTLIATPDGDRVVSDLAIGDPVTTASGQPRRVKWIGRRSYSGRFLRANARALPIRFRAGSLDHGMPRRDLLVSPEHAMFIDGLLIPARCLVNGVSVTQETGLDRVDYFHVELDSHDVILAEGAASETFVDDNSRMIFQNAHEFAALYPGLGQVPAVYCAPRIEDGFALQAIRARIDEHAGLGTAPVGLHGFIDAVDGVIVQGWAQDPARPEVPVCLDILLDGIVVAQALANRFRPDLLAAGLGSGCHSFRAALPNPVPGPRIQVRRSADGAVLGWVDTNTAAAA